MKNSIAFTILSSCFALLLFGNCKQKQAEKYKEDATDSVSVTEGLNRYDKDRMQDDIGKTIKKDWEKFKDESEGLVKNTGDQIKKLRENIAKFDEIEREKLQKTLDSLEQKNLGLKEKLEMRTLEFKENMIAFNSNAKEKQKKFQEEVKHDIDEIIKALEKIVTPNESIKDQ
ncbi:hypothetical protein ACOCEA_17490 [Maribacter sp. CXY002]|uniref:hypothetical protein n=1 Tax=Maribacter luteocoastalis TaxID=3407671 RepID=UPI003B6709E3